MSKWLDHESHVATLAESAAKLLPLVRFPQMLVSQIYMVEQSALYTQSECRECIHNLLSLAYRFRALCPSQTPLGVNFTDKFYLPRDYTDLSVDTIRMQNTLRFGIQVDVKMYRGPVPKDVRDGDWKITYRKQNDIWSLQLFAHETALLNNEAKVQATIIIYNDEDKPVHVHREGTLTCPRGNTVTIQTAVQQRESARSMSILIKPVP